MAALHPDRAWGDDVAADVLRRELAGEELHIGEERRLHAVVGPARADHLSRCAARDDDDGSGAGALEERERGLAAAHRGHDVDVEPRPPCLLGVATAHRAGRVRDEDVEPPEVVRRVGDEGAQRLAVGDVEGTAEGADSPAAEGGSGLFDGPGAAGAEPDVAALLREPLGDGAPDAARRARDDRPLPAQPEVQG